MPLKEDVLLLRRARRLAEILDRLQPVPDAWTTSLAGSGNVGMGLAPSTCTNYRTLIANWRKAMRWTPGLDGALSIMLASVVSTRLPGDQLWTLVLSPPSTGKSTLCEALATAREYIHSKSTLTRLYSGYKTDKEGKEDYSLVPRIRNKTLIIKDLDPLLKDAGRALILGQLRDLYDGTSRTHYNNAMSREYIGVRTTMIFCGTPAVREFDAAEFGARFLCYSIMDQIDNELEHEVLQKVARRACANLAASNGNPEGYYEADFVKAMKVTGGYVNYLRENDIELLSNIELDQDVLDQCIALGKFVAYLRARPSKAQSETAEREFASRLVSQHVKLAKCLPVVLGKKSVDDQVISRITKTSLDTCRGNSLTIVMYLYESLSNLKAGMSLRALTLATGSTEQRIARLLRFMMHIGIVERKQTKQGTRWVLTNIMRDLYKIVMQETLV